LRATCELRATPRMRIMRKSDCHRRKPTRLKTALSDTASKLWRGLAVVRLAQFECKVHTIVIECVRSGRTEQSASPRRSALSERVAGQ
jgi:hypothetical protein